MGAMKVSAVTEKLRVLAEASATVTVGIGPRSEGGFGTTADLKLTRPGLERAASSVRTKA
jgi:lipoyl-dependent peroxiredoxin